MIQLIQGCHNIPQLSIEIHNIVQPFEGYHNILKLGIEIYNIAITPLKSRHHSMALLLT
jgi:hypothetical protein